MKTLKELENLKEEKQCEITKLNDDIYKINKEILILQTGSDEGDIVVNQNGEKGILCFKGNCYWWGIRKYKKDGTLSLQVINCSNEWDFIDKK